MPTVFSFFGIIFIPKVNGTIKFELDKVLILYQRVDKYDRMLETLNHVDIGNQCL